MLRRKTLLLLLLFPLSALAQVTTLTYTGCQVTPAKCTDTISSNTTPGAWSVPQAQVAAAMASLQAQVTSLQAQLAAANANIAGLIGETNTLGEDYYQIRQEVFAYADLLAAANKQIASLEAKCKCTP